jgi:hypothetical protein
MEESENKGYTVKDKRHHQVSEEEKAAGAAAGASRETPKAAAAGAAQEVPLPEITFASFLVSLSSSAFISLGQIPDPVTGEKKKDLPLAKQTIDLMGMLREKTKSNLTSEEENLFDHLLYDLRMAYIKESA